jgi:hypothetical protein
MRHVDIKAAEVRRGRDRRLYPPGMPLPREEGAGALQDAAGAPQHATSSFPARMLDG